MKNKSGLTAVALGVVLIVFFVGFFLARSNERPGIEEGQEYSFGYTYVADMRRPEVVDDQSEGGTERVRVFDFSDRNFPEKSIIVPLDNGNGVPVLVLNPALSPNTIILMRVRLSQRMIDGVTYPDYEFLRWEYNVGKQEPQSIIPTLKPRS